MTAERFEVEIIHDPAGVLIRREVTDTEALAIAAEEYPDGPGRLNEWRISPEKWWRKVPGQWSDWRLYPAKPNARGAFPATLVSAIWEGASR